MLETGISVCLGYSNTGRDGKNLQHIAGFRYNAYNISIPEIYRAKNIDICDILENRYIKP